MRGATITFLFHYHHHLYFNPRAHKGRDSNGLTLYHVLQLNFNPRAHEGRDTEMDALACIGSDISIHAPMRGATYQIRSSHKRLKQNFNPRAHEGRDNVIIKLIFKT